MSKKRKADSKPPVEADSKAAEPAAEDTSPSEQSESPADSLSLFPIVVIGASASGLEAFSQLLHAMSVDTGLAFVLVQHLAPTHTSMLAEILSRSTSMPVLEVRDEPQVKPNHVYVIPPNRS